MRERMSRFRLGKAFVKEADEIINIWSQGRIEETIFNCPEEYLHEFIEVMALTTKHHFYGCNQPNENFSFIASSSLSGSAHPCASPFCRRKKLDQLTSFSALYADEVYIQNPFEHLLRSGQIRAVERHETLAAVQNYFYLKPLIEKEIIKYAITTVNFCEIHEKEIAIPLSTSIQQKEDKLVAALESYLIDRCIVVFDYIDGDKNQPFFEIKGPDNIIEHGAMHLHGYQPISNIFKPFLNKKVPYTLEEEEVQSSKILDQVIGPIVKDLSEQEWHSALNGTSYLCDNNTHMKIAGKNNNKAYVANSDVFEKSLKHYLPSIHAKSLEAIISLRNREEESFSVYRDKLNKFLKDSSSWQKEEISKIFREQLLPEINIIEKKVKDWKANAREGIKEKILFGTATASFGLYQGVLPSNISDIIAAIGGTAAVGGSLMEYNKTLKEKTEARKNDFYFLWQANK